MNTPTLTDTDAKALAVLASHGPCSCTELGELVWTENRTRNRQSWARPAGKALHRLRRLGLACRRRTRDVTHVQRFYRIHEWWLTDDGERAAKTLKERK